MKIIEFFLQEEKTDIQIVQGNPKNPDDIYDAIKMIQKLMRNSDRKTLSVQEWKKKITQQIAKSKKTLLLFAKDNDIIVGICLTYIDIESDKKTYYSELDKIFIEPLYRKYGIGRRFVVMTAKWVKSNGVKVLIVSTWGDNDKAIVFYKAVGFKPLMHQFIMRL